MDKLSWVRHSVGFCGTGTVNVTVDSLLLHEDTKWISVQTTFSLSLRLSTCRCLGNNWFSASYVLNVITGGPVVMG